MTDEHEPVLEVDNLTLSAFKDGRELRLLDGVSFEVRAGERLGIVGESGSGKSLTSRAIMGLLPANVKAVAGEIRFEGRDLLRLSRREMAKVRGSGISMILQDPMSSLDPSFTVGNQFDEVLRRRGVASRRERGERTLHGLREVRIPSPEDRRRQYPHQLSGGMRQRVVSALALGGEPRVLLADEPTTALDVTTQAYYLEMLRRLQDESGFALLMVTHDLLVVRHLCDRVVVMYAGQVMESGATEDVVLRPRHPYTAGLISSIPNLGGRMRLVAIPGQAPDLAHPPPGCRFAPRCAHARPECDRTPELLQVTGSARQVRCWGTAPGGWISAADATALGTADSRGTDAIA